MTDTAVGQRTEERRPAGRRRRRWLERVTPGLVVGLFAACIAFVLVAGVLRERDEMTTVLVTNRPVQPGARLDRDAVRVVEIPASADLGSSLLSEQDLDDGTTVAQRLLAAGEPVSRSAVGDASTLTGQRVVALPLDGWGEAGGELVVGDRVDVIDTRGEAATRIVAAALVVDRSSGGSGGLAGGAGVWAAIEVSEADALRVAEVVQANQFVLARAVGVVP